MYASTYTNKQTLRIIFINMLTIYYMASILYGSFTLKETFE